MTTIYVPSYLVSDFLGTVVIDILHDAKGRGVIQGRLLCELTDLLSLSFCEERQTIKNWVFWETFKYLSYFWRNNPTALGEFMPPDFYARTNVDYYRSKVKLPVRKVANKTSDDTFVTLGADRKGVEFQNYLDQKIKLSATPVNVIEFSSPNFNQASANKFIQVIKAVNPQAKVSLDMKSSAGLLRVITDPIGYVSSLAVYADPGYNMAGMSAIRSSSEIHFSYPEKKEFEFTILLESPWGWLQFLEPSYFWGKCYDDINRENLMVTILGEHFHRGLPKGSDMARALETYFTNRVTTTVLESREILKELEVDYREKVTKRPPAFINGIQKCYNSLNKQKDIKKTLETILTNFPIEIDSIDKMLSWTRGLIINTAYYLSTLKNIYYFRSSLKVKINLLPEELIPQISELMLSSYENKNISVFAFCWHQLNLIEEYLSQPIEFYKYNSTYTKYYKNLRDQLENQWLPKRKGKLINQRLKWVQDFYKNCQESLSTNDEINTALNNLVETGKTEINFSEDVLLILNHNLHFSYPQFIENESSELTILSLLNLANNLELYPDKKITVDNPQTAKDALLAILGKFTGDFGQIIWCIQNGQIFATEDSNTSAMACILHSIPNENIEGGKKWVSLHGWGDGSRVEAIF